MRKIFLTPDNVYDYQATGRGDVNWSECLKHHLEVNDVLDEELGNNDWGGRYASWLNNIGLEHQTEEGWWNATAVDFDNMELFVKYYKEDYMDDEYSHAVIFYENVKKIYKVPLTTDHHKVEELLKAIV